MEQKTIEAIQNHCWDLFMELGQHGEADVPVIQNGERHTITWLPPWDEGDRVVTEEEARKQLDKWIEETLNSKGKLFLYTCRDNAEVCPEKDITEEDIAEWISSKKEEQKDWDEENRDDLIDLLGFEMETIEGTIPEHILYIGFD